MCDFVPASQTRPAPIVPWLSSLSASVSTLWRLQQQSVRLQRGEVCSTTLTHTGTMSHELVQCGTVCKDKAGEYLQVPLGRPSRTGATCQAVRYYMYRHR